MRQNAISLAAIAAACLSLSMPAVAQDFSVQSGISTLGGTIEPAYRLSDRWGVRMPIATGAHDFDTGIGDRNFTGQLRSDAVGLLADYRPFAGGLRVSGGLIHTDYRASAVSESFTYEGATSAVYANIEQADNVSPMLALGYDARIGRAAISASMGGIFTSGFNVSGGQTGSMIDEAYADAELAKVRDEVNDLKSIPYVSLGVSFAF